VPRFEDRHDGLGLVNDSRDVPVVGLHPRADGGELCFAAFLASEKCDHPDAHAHDPGRHL
jgi:hypothetical protein